MVSVKGRRVFLSGPMSDDPDTYHVHDFIDAHIRVKELGAAYVYNPAIMWLRYDGTPRTHEDWMRACITELMSSWYNVPGDRERNYDLLVQLPGWEKSEGAKTEKVVADACGIETCNLSEVC